MTLIISHRGNLNGSNHLLENNPSQILKVLNLKFDVEIDVWLQDNNFFLGHDQPTYLIEESFLENEKLWCHAKNLESFQKMLLNEKIHCFWHETDKVCLTNKNIMWLYPGIILESIYPSIIVMPELIDENLKLKNVFGVCTDYPENFRTQF